ncbi:CDP-abequose synthase [Pandoraea communis]|uniref:CDP-abequose synthase n=1 Tax=Pandoraea communis TaxID=2508297 RepID=A0A5E4T763_9BURK|nr:NAD(P)-dependent oxidoreductase [Pandoraea communis]VVD83062.1 CDP-abequose synthase [Pandoraea communis]
MAVREGRGTVVITGASGYIGRKVASQFEADGWCVIRVMRPNPARDADAPADPENVVLYDGRAESLAPLSHLDPATTVFLHLAAAVEIASEIDKVEQLVDANIRLGMGLATFMIRHGFTRLVSTESYWQFDESGALGGNSLYAATKSSFSLMVEYLSRHYLRVASLVLYDVYGPNDARGKLLNALIEHAGAQTPFNLTAGEQIIDFIHVDDVADAFVVAARQLLADGATPAFHRYTVRSMRPLPLREYVGLIEKVTGRSIPVRWGGRPYPRHQIMKPWLPDASWQLPDWAATIRFEEGIASLVDNG